LVFGTTWYLVHGAIRHWSYTPPPPLPPFRVPVPSACHPIPIPNGQWPMAMARRLNWTEAISRA
jgi:hypothetical protein